MRVSGDVYEYIAVYVDDLAIASKQPKGIIDLLVSKYGFKLKGTGSIQYHLGMNFFRDEDGVLCLAPRKYVTKIMMSYEEIFGEKPKLIALSPLEKGDHPELDESNFLDDDWTQKYQSRVGSMQWEISIGRVDITTAVITMSSF